ncbi:UNVERIFIED_CONTAM: hypothetical protein PYX00_009029 [Menopon gallinae]|uniref:Lipase domain-containing protein n=1 Tax=Menopon gallinae TaxID=328185 RepID=A0AAW2H9V8_9NEOP
MGFVTVNALIAVGILTLHSVESSTPELNHIYFHGNGTQNVVYRTFNRRNVKFFMYNRARPNGFRLYQEEQSLRRSGYDSSNPTKVLIHGYMGSYRSNSIQMPKNAYMAAGNYNVVAVDWSAYNFPYAVAVNSARDVGNTVGDMVMFMSRTSGTDPSDVHVVGHSLGAHIAGYSGKSINSRSTRGKGKKGKGSRSKNRLGRITGLDPAAPAFAQNPPSQRLSSDDADYVDVIHTSIRLLGMARAIGNADFYPAGGKFQPRCPNNFMEQATGYCDHGESVTYFSWSIRNRHLFPATPCNSAREAVERRCSGESNTYMGEEAVRGSPGVYYVDVNHIRKGSHKKT